MSRLLTPLAACALCLAGPAAGQQTVPIDIPGLYDQIPAPPTSVDEAYRRAACTVEHGCDMDGAFEAIAARLTEVAEQIDLALAAASQPAADALQGVAPAELQKKLASMSQEEQIRFAMELSRQQAAAATPQAEPAPVRAAVAEMLKIREELGQEAVDGGPYFADRNAQLLADLKREHVAIDAWATSDQFKDASGLPGPDWDRAQVEAMEKHIGAEQDYQQALIVVFREEITRQKARYASFQQRLEAIRYGQDALNTSTRFNLIGIQQAMLRTAAPLLDASRTATRNGAEWRQRYLTMDQRNR